MDEQIRMLAERYAEEHRNEQQELLRALGKLPAPTRREDLRAAFCRDWLVAQTIALKIDARRHHMVNGSALHMDTVIVKGIFNFLHHTAVACHEPVGFDLGEQNAALQKGPGFHGKPVGRFFMVAVMGHEKIRMVTQQTQEGDPALPVPRRGTAEHFHTGQPDRVDAHGRLDGPPGMTRELVLGGGVLLIFHKRPHRPRLCPAFHLMQKFPGVFLVLCQGVGAGQRLPVNVPVQRPGPLVVMGGKLGGVEEPVNLAVKGMAVDGVVHGILGILKDSAIGTGFQLLGLEQVFGRGSGAEMLDDGVHRSLQVSRLIQCLCFFQTRSIIIDPLQQFCHSAHRVIPHSKTVFSQTVVSDRSPHFLNLNKYGIRKQFSSDAIRRIKRSLFRKNWRARVPDAGMMRGNSLLAPYCRISWPYSCRRLAASWQWLPRCRHPSASAGSCPTHPSRWCRR